MASGFVRQAVVIVHGMGEQRPLDTLNSFIGAALTPDATGAQTYYSRPEDVTGSYESRRFLAKRATQPGPAGGEIRAQTEFFEYHWAHLMQGNRIDDLWPTFRRLLLRPFWRLPCGLRLLWFLSWALVLTGVYAFTLGPLRGLSLTGENSLDAALTALLGSGLTVAVVSYLLSRLLPGWLASSFVDVVRYLDTSPRSYEVRRQIREGMVELLASLHDARLGARPRYQRIVVVAHSLGAYIAYDGITHLWGSMHQQVSTKAGSRELPGLLLLEQAASALPATGSVTTQQVADYQAAQRELWRGIRSQGNGWRITDLITVGTPLAFADVLYTTDRERFDARVTRREIATCPPQNEEEPANNINGTARYFTYARRLGRVKRRVLYAGAPFAVVRWTNLWFPARWGVLGDWFAGPLAPLFGPGVRDVPISGNRTDQAGQPTRVYRSRFVPAYAHSLYFRFPNDVSGGSVTTALREALALDSSAWANV
jgi:hypothetical protein